MVVERPTTLKLMAPIFRCEIYYDSCRTTKPIKIDYSSYQNQLIIIRRTSIPNKRKEKKKDYEKNKTTHPSILEWG